MCEIPTSQRSVTKALHAYPKKHGLDIEWIANELFNQFNINVGGSTLQRYLNPNDDLKLPADLVSPICIICNNDFSICSFIKKYEAKIEITNQTISILIKEAGEAVSELASAIEDGEIDHEERPRCVKELMDLKVLINKMLARLIE